MGIMQQQNYRYARRERHNHSKHQYCRWSRQKPNLDTARAQIRFNTSVLLVPPKPKELDTATRTGMSRAMLAQ